MAETFAEDARELGFLEPEVPEVEGTPRPKTFAEEAQSLGFLQPDVPEPEPASSERTFLGTAGDVGISALRGAIGIPEAVVGLADIVTGGAAGKFAEETLGFRPQEAKQILGGFRSDAAKAASQRFADAEGFVAKAQAAIENPSLIAETVIESAPLLLPGGAAGKVISKLPKVGAALSVGVAGAIGEGLVAAGLMAEGVRQQAEDGTITPMQALLSVGAGVGTAGFGILGAKVAQKLGIADIDVLAAGGDLPKAAAKKNIGRRVVEGALAEGFLEELPQSIQEQVFNNVALDKPVFEGVDEAAVLGILSGGVMGGAVQGVTTGASLNEENILASQIMGQPGGVSTASSTLGVDKEVLRERIGLLLTNKAQNPSLDLSSPEARQFLSGAVVFKEGGGFEPAPSPETGIPVPEDLDTGPPPTDVTDRVTEAAVEPVVEEPLPRRRAVIEETFDTREKARAFLDQQEGRIGVQIEEDAGGQFKARAFFREGERPETGVPEAEAVGTTGLAPEEVVETEAQFSQKVKDDPATQIALENVGLSSEQIAQVPDTFTLPTLWDNFDAKTQRAFTERAIAEGKAISEKPVVEGRAPGAVELIRPVGGRADTQEGRDSAVFEEITGDETRIWADDLKEFTEDFGADSPAVNGYIQALVADPATKAAIQGQMRTMGIPVSNAGLKTYVERIVAARGEVEFKRTDEEFVPGTQATQVQVTQKVQDLAAGVFRELRTPVKEGTFVAASPPRGQEAVYTELSKVLNKDIVFFKANNPPFQFDGATNISPNTIYINADAKAPHLAVTGHEFFHELKRDDRALYEEFRDVVVGLLPETRVTAKMASISKNIAAEGRTSRSAERLRDKAENELLADVFGEQFMTQEFWKKVEARSPETFAQVVEKFVEFIEKIKASFSGPQVADLNRAQNAAAKALASYIQKNPPIPTDLQAEADFKRMDEASQAGLRKLTETLAAVKNPRSKLADQRSRIFKVTPLPTLRDIYKDKVPQLVDFAKAVREQVATRSGIVSEITVDMQQALKVAKTGVGVETLKKAMATTSLYQMTPWDSLYTQDWVPEELRQQYLQGNASERKALEPTIEIAAQSVWEKNPVSKNTGKTFKEGYALAEQGYNDLKDGKLQAAFENLAHHTANLRLRTSNEVQRFIESVTAEGSEARESMLKRADLTFGSIKGAYFPLPRYGDYILEYRDKDGFLIVEPYDTEQQMKDAVVAMQSTGATAFNPQKRSKVERGVSAIPVDFLNQIQASLNTTHMAGVDLENEFAVAEAQGAIDTALEQINQVFLKWAPETSSLKNSVRRQSILGFSEKDMVRGYMEYAQTSAADIAYFRQGREMEAILRDIDLDIADRKNAAREEGGQPDFDLPMVVDVRNDVAARIASIRNIQMGKISGLLGKAASYWLLSSPRQLVVQMSQIPVLTAPKLAATYGMGKVTASLTSSINKAFSRKYSRQVVFDDESEDGVPVQAALEAIQAQVTPQNRDPENREFDPRSKDKELGDPLNSKEEMLELVKGLTEYQTEMLVLRYAMSQGLLDISLTHEAGQFQQGVDPDSVQAKVAKAMMVSLKLSELASRKSAILSTFQLVTAGTKGKGGLDFFDAMMEVAEVVDDTLFDFSVEAKGTLLQQGPARVLALFQHFNIMSTIKLITLANQSMRGESKENRQQAFKELTMILGVTGALSGALGMPFAGIIFALLDAFKDDDDFEDAEVVFKRELDDMLGGYGSQIARKGLPTMLGMDISRSVGFGKFLWTDINAPEYLHGDGLAAHLFTQLMGPAYAAPAGFVKGYDEAVNNGEYLRGLEAAVPKPIKDVLKALRTATEGVKTRGGKRLIEGDLRPDQLFMMAVGLPPAEVLDATTTAFKKKQISARISARIGDLAGAVAEAQFKGEDPTDALDDVRRFMKANPVFATNMAARIRSAYVKIAKGDLGMDSRREMLVDWKYFQ